MASVTNFRRLLSCLSGTALQAIQGLEVTQNSYSQAMAILQERYGDNDRNIAAHMTALIDMPPLSRPTASDLLSFHDSIEVHIRALKALGQQEGSFGNLLLPIIRRKLPDDTQVQLERSKGAASWSFEDFRKALYREAKALNIKTESKTPLSTAAFTVTARRRSPSAAPGRQICAI
jgi:hypothetical protein